ncbi:NUDIX domain-containing protein [Streptomyces sp. NPDC056549]|uniref:NUDIX domain-containing protein n=1 Tax=Streptomyces sp. NPDC056549 TaxID=3345864 RepID=UPI0036ACAEB3
MLSATGSPVSIVWGAVVFTDHTGRTLMLRDTSRHQRWLLPGGVADEGETPWDAAVRETHEEIGLHLTGPPRLLAVDTLIPRGTRVPMVGFMFDGGTIAADRIRLSDEHDTYLFAAPGDWPAEVPEEQLRRLASLEAARQQGCSMYLHDGAVPGATDA